MKFCAIGRALLTAAALGLATAGPAAAANPSMLKTFRFDHPAFVHEHSFAKHHLVMQVSEADPARWNLVLNNAQNVMDSLGAQEVQVVVVAYGPGLKMLLHDSKVAKRIAALDAEGVEFDACHNTMEAMAKATGHMPVLTPEAVIVPGGIVRIMQLEAHGFAYIRP